jgi:hypothetical protein
MEVSVPIGSIVRIEAGGRSFNVHRRVAGIFTAFINELVDQGAGNLMSNYLAEAPSVCARPPGCSSRRGCFYFYGKFSLRIW